MFCQVGVIYLWLNPFIKKFFANAKYILRYLQYQSYLKQVSKKQFPL